VAGPRCAAGGPGDGGERAVAGQMTPEEVGFSSGGERISAWYWAGAGVGRRPALVFCPGYTGTRYAAFYRPYVERLSGAGYSVLLLDYRGWGDSQGERGLILPLEQVADVRRALDWLETREDVDPGRLGLFGVSFGGGHATYVAGVDARVRALVAISAVADGARWLREMRREHEWQDFLDRLHRHRLEQTLTGRREWVDPTEEIMVGTPERRESTVKGSVPEGKVPNRTPLDCAEAILEYRPVDVAHRIRGAGLWFAVERDSIVVADHSRSLHAAAPEPKRLVVLPGREHYRAYVDHLEVISAEALAWYGAHLTCDRMTRR
jgi:pimeloyl-ACP methyl ester carboxylesterase